MQGYIWQAMVTSFIFIDYKKVKLLSNKIPQVQISAVEVWSLHASQEK